MTDEQRAELKRLAEKATKGPWKWWTSCSFRRLSSEATGKDGDVLHAVVHRDGVADIHGNETDRAFIAAAHPAAVLDLLAENERLRAALDVLERCAHAVIVDCVETRDVGGLSLASEACTNARRLLES